MPVHSCHENGKPGYKFGDSGKCYTYSVGDEHGRKEAHRKAVMQGVAIEHSMEKQGKKDTKNK